MNHMSPTFRNAWLAGGYDKNGNFMAGTEIMFLVPHKGKLYAGNSLWMESDRNIPKACQIFVLNSPDDEWQVDYQFSEANLRVSELESLTFSTDGRGNSIEPVSILLANPFEYSGLVAVYTKDDETGKWVKMVLGQDKGLASIRSIKIHRDAITGVDRVFAGSEPLGTFSGVCDPSVPGKINWDTNPEFPTPKGERVMGMTTCNSTFYCATSRHLYKRTDGSSPSWDQVFTFPLTDWMRGIRGLTAVPNPTGSGEVLLFTVGNKVHRLNPLNYEDTIELDENAFLSERWGKQVAYVLSAYSEFLPFIDPNTGETVWLFGFQAMYHPNVFKKTSTSETRVFSDPEKGIYYDAGGRYFIRHVRDGNINYEYVEVNDPYLDPEPMLVAVRTIAYSPFKGEEGHVLYLGGFDCNNIPAHNTGWIYRAKY